jgi:putative MATE family efflux protein
MAQGDGMMTVAAPDAVAGAPLRAPAPASSMMANPILSSPILPTLLRLGLPNMVAMLAMALVAMAETAYIGQLGTPALAAFALVFPMVMLQQMMSAGAMGGGVSSAISRALGAGQEARAEALAWHALVIGGIAGLAFTTLFLIGGPAIYLALGGRGAVLDEALTYSSIIFLGAVGIWASNTLSSIIRGAGNMKVPSTTLFLVSGAQVALGGILGLGLGPIPRLGMSGVALGQTLAYAGGAVYLLWYLTSGQARVRLSLRRVPAQWDMFRDILKVGALACASPVQTVLTVLVVTRLMSAAGTEALAGYGIGSRLEFLLVPITFAIGVACVPMVGTAIGAGEIARARRVAWTGGVLSAVIVGAVGALVALAPNLWSSLFTSEPKVLAAAAQYFGWVGPCYPLFGLGLCLYFASQGSGKVLGPVLAGTLRLIIVAAGGWWLSASAGTAVLEQSSVVFALIAISMAAFGLASALAVYAVSWDPRRIIRVPRSIS